MKWGYKTVHFELKKEGILGSGFLDESEIEQELNEFGQNGWELVSVLEVHDGIIVFFKQQLGQHAEVSQHYSDHGVEAQEFKKEAYTDQEYKKKDRLEDSVPEDNDVETDMESEKTAKDGSPIGAIRIE